MAGKIHDAAEERFFSAVPQWPAPPPLPDWYSGDGMTVGELEFLQKVAPDHPLASWLHEARASNADAWAACHAERERLREETGVSETEALQEACLDEADALCRRILELPAATFAGMQVKLRLREHFDGPDNHVDILESVTKDIEAMDAGGGNG
ncbi:MAG TPA: hypothetical protein VGA77_11385 [Propylenella sp.]